jgi:microcystin-dependent protein
MTAPPPVPALPDAARATTYSPVGSAGPFNVGFAIYGDSTDYTAWISVTLSGVAQVGNWTLDSPTGALATLPRPITDARITFTAPITGTLVITGARRPRRTSQNADGRGVTARDWNQVITDVYAMLRETWDRWGRSLLAPPGESISVLPSATSRASQMLGFDANGNPIAAQPSSALVSSAMQDVTASASHAAALALLGGAPLTAIIPVGMPGMWPGFSAPSLWLPRDGTTRLRAGFPELWAVLAPSFACTALNGNGTVTGIGSTAGWRTGMPVEGAAFAPGTTVATIAGANSITLSAPAIADGATMQVYPWGNGDGVNTFALPNAIGRVDAGLDTATVRLTGATGLGAVLGTETVTLTHDQIPAHNHGVVDPGHAHSTVSPVSILQGPGGVSVTPTYVAPTGGTTGSNTTGITTSNNSPAGGSHANVQPTQIYLPIIYAGR